jgi:hypothetical protein
MYTIWGRSSISKAAVLQYASYQLGDVWVHQEIRGHHVVLLVPHVAEERKRMRRDADALVQNARKNMMRETRTD